jgi:hypothetical protein
MLSVSWFQLTTCSLELSAAYLQPASSLFLSQQINPQYFQPLIFSQANRQDVHSSPHLCI